MGTLFCIPLEKISNATASSLVTLQRHINLSTHSTYIRHIHAFYNVACNRMDLAKILKVDRPIISCNEIKTELKNMHRAQ